MDCCSRSSPASTLFGGLRAALPPVARRLPRESDVRRDGHAPHFTLAPTAFAALAAARAGARCFITDPQRVVGAAQTVAPLRVALARSRRTSGSPPWACTRSANSCACRAPGSRAVSDTAAPDLDRLLGSRADPRRRVATASVIAGGIDLDHEIDEHDRLLRALEPLLAELENFLRVRQRGITALRCRFHHYRAPPTVCVLRLAAPEANARGSPSLLRERLATLVLARAGAPLRIARRCADGARGREQRLVVAGRARVRARGRDAGAGGASARAARRIRGVWPAPRGGAPAGAAWRVAEPGASIRPQIGKCLVRGASLFAAGMPPLPPVPWLLQQPEPLAARRGRPRYDGALDLLAGPERIESGWWDGSDVQRDYYVARDARWRARLWIYPRACAGAAALVPAWHLRLTFDERRCARLRRAALPQQLQVPARRLACRGAGRRAHALGYRALAITDECSVAGVVRAHMRGEEDRRRLKLHHRRGVHARRRPAVSCCSRATARGYGSLSRLITRGRRAAPKGSYRLTRADVAELLRRLR